MLANIVTAERNNCMLVQSASAEAQCKQEENSQTQATFMLSTFSSRIALVKWMLNKTPVFVGSSKQVADCMGTTSNTYFRLISMGFRRGSCPVRIYKGQETRGLFQNCRFQTRGYTRETLPFPKRFCVRVPVIAWTSVFLVLFFTSRKLPRNVHRCQSKIFQVHK